MMEDGFFDLPSCILGCVANSRAPSVMTCQSPTSPLFCAINTTYLWPAVAGDVLGSCDCRAECFSLCFR